jgi:hypothetical protein
MPEMLVQVAVPYTSAIPEDVSVNNWSFTVASLSESNYEQVGTALGLFYAAILPFYSNVLNFGSVNLRFYARDDQKPRVPRVDVTTGFGTGNTANGLPEEVASCLSFQGNQQSGFQQARRRGRLFLGPLNRTNAIESDSLGRARPSSAFRTNVRVGYEALRGALTTSGNNHVVWSDVNQQGYVVTSAWMDNAFDTQRRRGVRPTFKTDVWPPED